VSTAPPRLITLAISPFNELARWSLEYAGLDYVEDRKPLVFHAIASRRAGGKGTTPVLITEDSVVGESAEISEWASRRGPRERRLYPDGAEGEEVRSLVQGFVDNVAPASRRLVWSHLIDDLDLACAYWAQGLTRREARMQGGLTRLARRRIAKVMKLGPHEPEASTGVLRSCFDEVAARIAERGRIIGDRLTAADLAFAAMVSPAILPPEGFPVDLPEPGDFRDDIAATIRELREHPAGEYALALYRDER
jgi:glutathione S-transferase